MNKESGMKKIDQDDSDSLIPFGESIKLLRDLADLQNGSPLEQHRKEWEATIKKVYDFLDRWEGQFSNNFNTSKNE